MTVRAPALAAAALLLGGCALPTMPGWMPWLGKKTPPSAPATPGEATAQAVDAPKPGDVRRRPVSDGDEAVTDRIVAVVNNDAITLAELQEWVAKRRAESRQQRGPSDDELMQDQLNQLIEIRLKAQEADREKVVVEDAEVNEEYAEVIKRYGVKNEEEFEKLVRAQGLTVEALKRRVRENLKVQKLVRRKVTLRVSVTDAEITQYLEENRDKLETGLSYHARHILVSPEADTDRGWESARIKADMLRSQLQDGADFAELARQHSRDASARDGGDLGTLKRGELSQDIEAAILALQPGALSRPFKSPLGYHIFRLDSKEALDGDGLTRIRQQIRDILFRQKFDTRLDTWLKEIRQRAIIEVRL